MLGRATHERPHAPLGDHQPLAAQRCQSIADRVPAHAEPLRQRGLRPYRGTSPQLTAADLIPQDAGELPNLPVALKRGRNSCC